MEKNREQANINILMERYMKGNGLMVNNQEKEELYIQMEEYNKENGSKEKGFDFIYFK